ncbi:MAG: aminotransferase class V-fold PLP-dependent enzyme, partial [Nitrospiraceae bacterium]|nr:aminotransferase class V-fold PLP-dependent enzyme [Nitrospiraceae bacterium]
MPDLNDNVSMRVYLDNAAATPINKKALEAMMPYLTDNFGNPSAIYQEGLNAKSAISKARLTVKRVLNCRADEVYFMSGGTESDNLAICGVVQAYCRKNSKNKKKQKPHIITSVIEHSAVMNTIKEMEEKGMIEATYISVDKNGLVD